jgi:hypothetical protein
VTESGGGDKQYENYDETLRGMESDIRRGKVQRNDFTVSSQV